MQVAAVLSDLKTLAACPPEAALNLVTVHKRTPTTAPSRQQVDSPSQQDQASSTDTETSNQPVDPDLTRASTLIALHQSVKVKYEESGLDEELLQGREDVRRILGSLGTR